MTAYATSEPLLAGERLRAVDPAPRASAPPPRLDATVIDTVLCRLADLVVERLLERTAASTSSFSQWMDAREAAEYLGIHRDTLRKLAAERAVPTHQDGPGCKLYFRRDELDDWRRSSRSARRRLRVV